MCLMTLTGPASGSKGSSSSLVTQTEFVADAGQSCPRCFSDNLAFHERENDFGVVMEKATCIACSFSFERIFELTGYRPA